MDDSSSTSSRSTESPPDCEGFVPIEDRSSEEEASSSVPMHILSKKDYAPRGPTPERPPSVKRRLWEANSEEVDDGLTELEQMTKEENVRASKKWNFDFENERPLEGPFKWKKERNATGFYATKEVQSKKRKWIAEDQDVAPSSSQEQRPPNSLLVSPQAHSSASQNISFSSPSPSCSRVQVPLPPSKKHCASRKIGRPPVSSPDEVNIKPPKPLPKADKPPLEGVPGPSSASEPPTDPPQPLTTQSPPPVSITSSKFYGSCASCKSNTRSESDIKDDCSSDTEGGASSSSEAKPSESFAIKGGISATLVEDPPTDKRPPPKRKSTESEFLSTKNFR